MQPHHKTKGRGRPRPLHLKVGEEDHDKNLPVFPRGMSISSPMTFNQIRSKDPPEWISSKGVSTPSLVGVAFRRPVFFDHIQLNGIWSRIHQSSSHLPSKSLIALSPPANTSAASWCKLDILWLI